LSKTVLSIILNLKLKRGGGESPRGEGEKKKENKF